jgi:uncharacterized protein with GYD domain
MQTFIMLTTLEDTSIDSPQMLERREKEVMDRVREHCAGVEWIGSYAILGPYDYVDLFQAPDVEAALKVSTLIRTIGHAHTEVWPATDWRRFKEIARSLAEVAEEWR